MNVYALVGSHDSIRIRIVLTAGEGSFLEEADMRNTVQYGDVGISTIMENSTDSTKVQAIPGHVCKLHKSLYCAKQEGVIWGSFLDDQLKDWTFRNLEYGNRIYFYLQGFEFIVISIFVDDLAFSSNSPFLLQRLKYKLNVTFDVRLFG